MASPTPTHPTIAPGATGMIETGMLSVLNPANGSIGGAPDPNNAYWFVQNSAATVLGNSAMPNGWVVSRSGSLITITVPLSTPLAVNYTVYHRFSNETAYMYGGFDVAQPAVSPPSAPTLTAMAITVANVPTNRLVQT